MKIAIAGSSGMIGNALKAALKEKEHEVVVLRRDSLSAWPSQVDGTGAVINLAGEPIVGKRWSEHQKQILRDSRIQTTRAIVDAIKKASSKPQVLINASAIGYYGPRGEEKLGEGARRGDGFLADVCSDWESEALQACGARVRVVLLRTGVVLDKKGGALAKMLPPFRLGLGGPIGDGRQYMSWIHLEDEIGAILKALEDKSIEGALNLTAPQAVSMKTFSKTLGRVLKRPAVFPVPGFILKTALGEMSEMLLTGQNVYPEKLVKTGYHFKYPSLDTALYAILRK